MRLYRVSAGLKGILEDRDFCHPGSSFAVSCFLKSTMRIYES